MTHRSSSRERARNSRAKHNAKSAKPKRTRTGTSRSNPREERGRCNGAPPAFFHRLQESGARCRPRSGRQPERSILGTSRPARVGYAFHEVRHNAEKALQNLWIELPACVGIHESKGMVLLERSAIRPVAGERVVDVRHAENPRRKRDLLTGETVGIA